MPSLYQGGKTRLERITAAAHARHAATFNPQLHVERVKKQNKPRRRVSMGVVMDAATGEVLEEAPEESVAGKRKSRRMSTILSRTATEHRLRDAERRVWFNISIAWLGMQLMLTFIRIAVRAK